MTISEAHVGRSYPPTPPYRISRAKIAEFASALGDANPAYSGETPVAPPTFAVVISSQAWGSLFDDPELGLALHRTVHGDQRFTWTRPLREGDDVTAVLTIEKVRNRGTADMVTVRVDLSTLAGEHVCSATSTLLHSHPTEGAVA